MQPRGSAVGTPAALVQKAQCIDDYHWHRHHQRPRPRKPHRRHLDCRWHGDRDTAVRDDRVPVAAQGADARGQRRGTQWTTCGEQQAGNKKREAESCGCLDAVRRPATMRRAARNNPAFGIGARFQGGGVCVKTSDQGERHDWGRWSEHGSEKLRHEPGGRSRRERMGKHPMCTLHPGGGGRERQCQSTACARGSFDPCQLLEGVRLCRIARARRAPLEGSR